DAEAQVADLDRRLAGIRLDRAGLEAIRAAARDRERAEAALAAARPRLEWTALTAQTLQVDGRPQVLEAGTTASWQPAGPWTLEEPGRWRLHLQPASLPGLAAARDAAAGRLAAALAAAGVADAGAAEAAWEALQALEAARRRLQDLLDGRPRTAWEAEAAALEAQAGPAEPAEAAPEPAALERELSAAEAELAAAEAAREEANRSREAAAVTLGLLEQHLAGLAGETAARGQDLAARRERLPDAELDAARHAATAAVAGLEAEVARSREALAALDPEGVRQQEAAARTALETRQRERDHLLEATRLLEGSVQERGSQGLREQLERAEAACEHLQREAGALRRRAEAARRLYRTLEAHRERARHRYHEPLRGRIRALGRHLWGEGFDIELGPDLAVTTRVLDGQALPVPALSLGAREQLALLARIAAAGLVAGGSPGQAVPLILDDTLGHSDPARVAAMRRVLELAARDLQVILLTPDPARFRDLPGHWVDLGPEPPGP
ncbi:MAG: hypothetical protein OWV35_10480, partial [Firmicutes bacterium]|nr:hypothetical protein [Bacillota bacterium]